MNDPSLKPENVPNVINTFFYTFCIIPPDDGSLKLKYTVAKLHISVINTDIGEMVFVTDLSWRPVMEDDHWRITVVSVIGHMMI